MAWTKVEPTVTSFTFVDGPDTYVYTISVVGSVKRASLSKNGTALGQYIDFPNTAFIAQLFAEVGPQL